MKFKLNFLFDIVKLYSEYILIIQINILFVFCLLYRNIYN